MNNSESTIRSAPSALARARAARALAALPATSPIVGFNWASVMENWSARSVMSGSCLGCAKSAIASSDNAHALGEREQPENAGGEQRHADRRRTHVLDPA